MSLFSSHRNRQTSYKRASDKGSIKDEIDGFVKYLNDTFGENKMSECIEYLLRLKKMG